MSVALCNWSETLDWLAARIRESDVPLSLRNCFYKAVSAGLLPNTRNAYNKLSYHTTRARERGTFPELSDDTRDIHRVLTFTSPSDARQWLYESYRVDRTEGQSVSLYVGAEKAGHINLLVHWFSGYGIPVLALGGYASHPYKKQVRADVLAQSRPAILLYAGDFDGSGEDIDRDFIAKTRCWDEVIRVALSAEQVEAFGLPEQMGKVTDSRTAAFVARHGRNIQVELDALDPAILRDLFTDAIARYWDMPRYKRLLVREARERRELEPPR